MEFWKGFEGFWRGFWCCLGGFSIVILRVWCSVGGPWDDIFVKFLTIFLPSSGFEVFGNLWWFVAVCEGSWWFMVVCDGLCWFMVVCGSL